MNDVQVACRQWLQYQKGRFIARGHQPSDAPGEFVALIGHSGCGNPRCSTSSPALSAASSGRDAVRRRARSPARPGAGVVFQNHSAAAWLTCFENVYLAVVRACSGQGGPGPRAHTTGGAPG